MLDLNDCNSVLVNSLLTPVFRRLVNIAVHPFFVNEANGKGLINMKMHNIKLLWEFFCKRHDDGSGTCMTLRRRGKKGAYKKKIVSELNKLSFSN